MRQVSWLVALIISLSLSACDCVCDDGAQCLQENNENNCFNTAPPKVDQKMQAGGGGSPGDEFCTCEMRTKPGGEVYFLCQPPEKDYCDIYYWWLTGDPRPRTIWVDQTGGRVPSEDQPSSNQRFFAHMDASFETEGIRFFFHGVTSPLHPPVKPGP